MSPYIALTIAIVTNAAANVALKFSATKAAPNGFIPFIRSAATNIPLLIAISTFALTLFFTQSALRSLPLSAAYPIFATGVLLIVTVASIFFFHERLPATHVVGIVLAVSAIALLTRPT